VAFLRQASGIENSTAYVQSWLKTLKNDKRMAIIASSQAPNALQTTYSASPPSGVMHEQRGGGFHPVPLLCPGFGK
jgi:antirestriction protein ArdC